MGHRGPKISFEDPEPAAAPAPLADVLDKIAGLIRRCVVLDGHAIVACTLWAAQTWTAAQSDHAPILLIRSPLPRCGKTTLMTIIGHFVRRPLPAANVTPAALFRILELHAPTLLIDEGDTFLSGNDELRGILNAGHTRANAFVLRTVGDDHEPRRFDVYGPKAIALIGKAPETISDRSIVVELRRKIKDERVERMRRIPHTEIATLRAELAALGAQHAAEVGAAEPHIPDQLSDRAADSWRPLLAIADITGGKWPDLARSAAVALSAGSAADGGLAVELLADVRVVLQTTPGDRIAGADLLAALLDDAERPWATLNHGKPMSQAQLARRLSTFGIVSRTVRLPDGRIAKGYLRTQFEDAFERYLSPHETVTPLQASTGAGCNAFANRYGENAFRFEKALQASTGAGCNGVTVSTPPNHATRVFLDTETGTAAGSDFAADPDVVAEDFCNGHQ